MSVRGSARGFTLIELLVVILIVAILASIAIPVFLKQREKGWEAQVTSALKDASTALEVLATDNFGVYAGVDGADSDSANAAYVVLTEYGFNKSDEVRVQVETDLDDTLYCVTATHDSLPTGHPW